MSIWLDSEDLQLCISYNRRSVDPITGSAQKSDKLWSTVHSDYVENWEIGHGELRPEPRSQIAVSSRFTKLKPMLKTWGAALAYARRNVRSGDNSENEIRNAQSWYFAQKKKEFTKFDCWEVLKDHPYFRILERPMEPSSNYTSTPMEPFSNYTSSPMEPSSNYTSTPTRSSPSTIDLSVDEVNLETPHTYQGSSSPVRPMGVKAAKEAKRKGKGKKVMTSPNEVRDDAMKSIAENQKLWIEGSQKGKDAELLLLQEQVALKRKEFHMKELAEETKIMCMDTDIMTPKSKRYFSRRKMEILKKQDEEHQDDEEDVGGSGPFPGCYRPLF